MRSYIRAQLGRFFGLNLTAVTPLIFVGGQFAPEQWPAIHALGVRAVLSLQAEREDRFAGPAPERTLRLHVVDFTAPSAEQIEAGVSFIGAAHADALPVLVHCHGGIGRAPLMAAAYLMSSEALSHREALQRVRAARPIIGPNAEQLRALSSYEARLRTRTRRHDEAML